jgi:MFS family permease
VYLLAVLTLAYVLAFVDRQILSLLIEPMKASLALSDTQIGLLHGLAFGLSYSLLAIPIGRLADRGHRLAIIGTGLGTWSAATALLGLARDFTSAFLFRIGVGAGEAAIAPAAVSLLSDSFERRRALAIGVLVAGGPLGASLALLAGGWLLDTYARIDTGGTIGLEPWRAVLLTIGVVPAAVVLLLLATLREPLRRSLPASAVAWSDVWRFLRSRRRLVACHLAGMSLFTVVAYAIAAWGPTLFVRHFGWSAGRTGLVFGLAIGVAGALGALAGGACASWLERRGVVDAPLRTALAGVLLLFPVAAVAPLVASPALALSLFAVCLFLMNFPSGPSLAAIQEVTPPQFRAQLTAAYFVVLSLVGMGLGALAVGVLSDHLFARDRALRHALCAVALIALPAAAALLYFALAPYRRWLPGRAAA